MSQINHKFLQKKVIRPQGQKKRSANQHTVGVFTGAALCRDSVTPLQLRQLQQTAGNQSVTHWLQAPAGSQTPGQVPSDDILNARGVGQDLPSPLRQEMEQQLNMDMSGVRVHTDETADQLNQNFKADAFTVGKDIFFRRGAYLPHSEDGQKLLKHELAHVAQQRGAVPAQLQLGRRNDVYEQEAEKFSVNQSSGSVSPVQAGLIQRGRFGRSAEQDDDYTSYDSLGGGTMNPVFRVGHGGGAAGYFKPNDSPDSKMASKSVVSSRLDEMLGTKALSRERFARYQGASGGESFEIPGRPMYETEFNTPSSQREKDEDIDQGIYKTTPTGVFKRSGTRFMRHDFSHPETQRSMSNIQLQDAITGQFDRHGGNMKIGDDHVARGFDNDQISISPGTFKKPHLRDKSPEHKDARRAARLEALNVVNTQFGKQTGLPSHLDQATAESLLKLKSKKMVAQLKKSGAQGNLSDAEIEALRTRYSAVRRYAKAGMAASGQVKDKKKAAKWSSPEYQGLVREGTGKIPTIVGRGGWGAGTYTAQLNEAPQSRGQFASYLQRGATDMEAARRKPTGSESYLEPAANPFVAAHPSGGAPTLDHGQAAAHRQPPPFVGAHPVMPEGAHPTADLASGAHRRAAPPQVAPPVQDTPVPSMPGLKRGAGISSLIKALQEKGLSVQ